MVKSGQKLKKNATAKENTKLLTIDGKKIRLLVKLKRYVELKKYLDPSIFRLLTKKVVQILLEKKTKLF